MSDTGSAIHVTTASAYTDSQVYEVDGTAAGLGSPIVDVYDNGTLSGPTGVFQSNGDPIGLFGPDSGSWQTEVVLTPGDNLVSAGPYGGTAATSDNTVDLFYEPAFDQPAYGYPVNVTVDQAGGNTNSATQSLSGTVSSVEFGTRLVAGTTLTLSDDSQVLGHATVGADGSWSAKVTLPSQGRNLVTVADTDLAGNTGDAFVDFELKTSVPSVAITGGGTVDQQAQVISGTATAGDVGDVITLSEDGTAIGTAAVGADGTWALSTTLSRGTHVFQATDADRYGNVGTSGTVSYTYDPAQPVAPAAAPPQAAQTSDPAQPAPRDGTPPGVSFGPAPQLDGTAATLTGTASDAGGINGVEIFDGSTDLGAAQVNRDGSWSFTHDFGQGSYDHLTAIATDAAGNHASAAALFGLDTGLSTGRAIGAVTTFDAGGAVTSVTTTSRDGSVGAQTVSNGDGTATSTGYESGSSLFSIGDDVMTGNGYREDFVFQPTMGHARVTDFVADGPGHDTITLSHQDFANVAQVLNRTTMSHGSALIHVSPEDTIRLAGVTRADLAQHRGDFAFTN